jgi:serine/threonine-protein kinase
VSLIAETHLSRIYEARPADAPLSQPACYAVKVLRREWWNDAEAISAIRREAMVGARVSHPNIVPVLSAQVASPPFYLAMPRLDGTTVAQLLEQQPRLPIAQALWITRQVVEGLEALYSSQRMVHGDVKPANLLIGGTGHVTLLDLGFAHTIDEALQWQSLRMAASLGYVAPELTTSAFASSPHSELYSVGVVLYELLAGKRPFASDDPGDLVAQHRTARPECIRSVRPEVPKRVASLVHTLLSKEPLRRGASYREIIDRLVRLEIEAFAFRAA